MGDGQTVNGHAIAILTVSAIMSLLAILTVVLRFVARTYASHRYYLDDYLITFALVPTLGVTINNIVGVALAGIGEHEEYQNSGPYQDFPLSSELLPQGKVMFALQLLHTCAMPLIKASILAFYARLFPTRRFKVAVYAVSAYVLAWWVSAFFVTIFQCRLISDNWGTEPAQLSGCIPGILAFYQAIAFLNMIGDVLVLALPIPVVAKLHMPLNHRAVLLGIFLSGALVVAAGIGRSVAYFKANYNGNYDFSYWYYSLVIWSSVEPTLGVICACLPTLRPLFARIPLEAFMHSIRSIFSLQTAGSKIPKDRRRISDDRQHLPSGVGNAASTLNTDSQGGIFFQLPDPNGSSQENQNVAMEMEQRKLVRKGMPAKAILVQEDMDQNSIQSSQV